jgi:thioredoxin 1
VTQGEGEPMNIRQQEQVLDVTSEVFDRLVINSPVPVLVNFETPWSKRMIPLLGQLAETFTGRLRVVQVNISADPDLARRLKIRAVPTLLVFKKGIPTEFIVGTVPSRFVFETVCKTLGVSPYSTEIGRPGATRSCPTVWKLMFEWTLA